MCKSMQMCLTTALNGTSLRCGYDLCKDSEIMSVADAMATNGMKEIGYEYINLDGISLYLMKHAYHRYSSDINMLVKVNLVHRLLG